MTRFELIWRNFWLALRRAPKDKRALFAIAWLLYTIGAFAYLIWTLTYLGIWGSICWGVMMGLGVGLALLIRRNNARTEKSLLSLSNYKSVEFEDLADHRAQLVKVLLRTAILVDRAGAEVLSAKGKIADEHKGISRRRTLDLAKRPELWDCFPEEERLLLLRAEGTWDRSVAWTQINLIEDVRVLRWVIQLDSILVPFEFVKPDLAPAIEITAKPEITDGIGCMAPWDLRPARDQARLMLDRCAIEGLARGFFETEKDLEDPSLYLEIADRFKNDQSNDLLIGAQTVASATEDDIRWIGQLAMRRAAILDRIIQYLGGRPDAWLEPEVMLSETD
jgi:hypothetical protein